MLETLYLLVYEPTSGICFLRSLPIELNLMHKFTKNGSFVRAFDEKVRRFFESRLMRTCSRIAPPLPATLSAPLYHLNNELVYYRDQVLNILELQTRDDHGAQEHEHRTHDTLHGIRLLDPVRQPVYAGSQYRRGGARHFSSGIGGSGRRRGASQRKCARG